MKTGFAVWVLIGLASFALPALAETPTQGEETVPLYTNADLARFGPAPAPPVRDPELEARSRLEEWERVQRYLDREYARIDAARALESENRLLDGSRDLDAREPGVFSYPGIWPDDYAGYGAWRPQRHHDDPGYRILPNSLGSRIIQGGHGRYSHMQGSDAFPGPARPPAGRSQPHPKRPR